ncbi:MAG: isocitrate/isopropylmalate dehydrogenase family protein [Deltaproteobacteria bacterium]|nr:isocitrate/isopropylmalate dehydrogenase family protein [Deltaproteobacteria bacterium]
MARLTVVCMPGDGIGPIVLPEALRVLDAVGFEADYVQAEVGWECWRTRGEPLPARTLELLETWRLGLFGAATSKPMDQAESELPPELQGRGLTYYSPSVAIRQAFDLDVAIRPCRSFPGNPLNFIRRAADGSVEEPRVDVVVFRQNTEGLYSGVEWTHPPPQVRAALDTHRRMVRFRYIPSEDMALSCRIFTRPACLRIAEAAFRYADEHGYPSVTCCEKPNIVRETSGMLLAACREVQRAFPHVDLWATNIDTMTMWLTKNPEDYGVIVSGNVFGDILSDAFAGLVGGLGFAPSASIGARCAIFEPTHGSAPKYAGYEVPIVNPVAMILAGAMLLDHVGERERARRIHRAVARVVADARVRTCDMLRLRASPEVLGQGAASTREMTDAVIQAL